MELGVPDREHFIDHQYLWFNVSRDRECEPNIHTAAVPLDGGIDKFLNFGKCDNRVELALDFAARHPKDSAVQKDVLAPRKLLVKPGAHFQETRHSSCNGNPTLSGIGNAAENFQERRFAGAIAADDANAVAAQDLERHILERPELFDLVALARSVDH